MSKNKYTAFIFARGGSKGVVNKNIREVAGKPLLAYSIECALASCYIGAVIVSTDSDEISSVAKHYGAGVLARPPELAGDTSPELLAWKHAIDSYPLLFKSGAPFVSLPATSPLRATQDIDSAIDRFHCANCDVVFGITPSHRNPYLNMVTVTESQLIEIVNGGNGATRRQDTPSVFDITTCVYVGDAKYIAGCEQLMQGDVGYVEIPAERSLDIDTEFDLHLAGLMIKSPYTSPDKQINATHHE